MKILALAFGFIIASVSMGYATLYDKNCLDWEAKAKKSDVVTIAKFKKFINPEPRNKESFDDGIFDVVYSIKENSKLTKSFKVSVARERVNSNSGLQITHSGSYYVNPGEYSILFLLKDGDNWKLTECLSHIPLETVSLEDKGLQKLLDIFLKGEENGNFK